MDDNINYDKKLQEMQKKYLPFLNDMIIKSESASSGENSARGNQLDKLKSLKQLLTTSKRMKMENLIRCEEILKKLEICIGKPSNSNNKNEDNGEKNEKSQSVTSKETAATSSIDKGSGKIEPKTFAVKLRNIEELVDEDPPRINFSKPNRGEIFKVFENPPIEEHIKEEKPDFDYNEAVTKRSQLQTSMTNNSFNLSRFNMYSNTTAPPEIENNKFDEEEIMTKLSQLRTEAEGYQSEKSETSDKQSIYNNRIRNSSSSSRSSKHKDSSRDSKSKSSDSSRDSKSKSSDSSRDSKSISRDSSKDSKSISRDSSKDSKSKSRDYSRDSKSKSRDSKSKHHKTDDKNLVKKSNTHKTNDDVLHLLDDEDLLRYREYLKSQLSNEDEQDENNSNNKEQKPIRNEFTEIDSKLLEFKNHFAEISKNSIESGKVTNPERSHSDVKEVPPISLDFKNDFTKINQNSVVSNEVVNPERSDSDVKKLPCISPGSQQSIRECNFKGDHGDSHNLNSTNSNTEKDNRLHAGMHIENKINPIQVPITNNNMNTSQSSQKHQGNTEFQFNVLQALKEEIDDESPILQNFSSKQNASIPYPKLNCDSNDNEHSKARRISFEKYKEKLNSPSYSKSKNDMNCDEQSLNDKNQMNILLNKVLTPKELQRFGSVLKDDVVKDSNIESINSPINEDSLVESQDSSKISEHLDPESPDSSSSFQYLDEDDDASHYKSRTQKYSNVPSSPPPQNMTHNIITPNFMSKPLHLMSPVQRDCIGSPDLYANPQINQRYFEVEKKTSDLNIHPLSRSPKDLSNMRDAFNSHRIPLAKNFNVGFPVSARYKGKNPKPLLGFNYHQNYSENNFNLPDMHSKAVSSPSYEDSTISRSTIKCESSKELSLHKSAKALKQIPPSYDIHKQSVPLSLGSPTKIPLLPSPPIQNNYLLQNRNVSLNFNQINSNPDTSNLSKYNHSVAIKDPRLRLREQQSQLPPTSGATPVSPIDKLSFPKKKRNKKKSKNSNKFGIGSSSDKQVMDNYCENIVNSFKIPKIQNVPTQTDAEGISESETKTIDLKTKKQEIKGASDIVSPKNKSSKDVVILNESDKFVIYDEMLNDTAVKNNEIEKDCQDKSIVYKKDDFQPKKSEIQESKCTISNPNVPNEDVLDHSSVPVVNDLSMKVVDNKTTENKNNIALPIQVGEFPNQTNISSVTDKQKNETRELGDVEYKMNTENSAPKDSVISIVDVLTDKQKLLEMMSADLPANLKKRLQLLVDFQFDDEPDNEENVNDSGALSTSESVITDSKNEKAIDGAPIENVESVNNQPKKRQRKPRLRNEVDLLRQGIPDEFMNNGPINNTGIRMCRLIKELNCDIINETIAHINKNSPSKSRPTNKSRENENLNINSETKKTLIKEMSEECAKKILQVNIEKIPTLASKGASIENSVSDVVDFDHYNIRPCPKSKKTQMLQKTIEKTSDAPKKGKKQNTARKKCSTRTKKGDKRNETFVGNDTISDAALTNIPKFKRTQSKVNQKNDTVVKRYSQYKTYHFNSDLEYEYDCKYCDDYKGSRIVPHYVEDHPHREVLISRLSPAEAKLAITEAIVARRQRCTLDSLGSSNISDYQCRFCLKTFQNCHIEEFSQHITHFHTGEYENECDICSNYEFDKKVVCSKKHTISNIDPNIYVLKGFICEKCNYTQMSEKNLNEHISERHSGVKCEMYEINLSKISASESNNRNLELIELPLPACLNTKEASLCSEIGDLPIKHIKKEVMEENTYSDSIFDEFDGKNFDIKEANGIFSLTQEFSNFSDGFNSSSLIQLKDLHIKEEFIENNGLTESIPKVKIKAEPLPYDKADVKIPPNSDYLEASAPPNLYRQYLIYKLQVNQSLDGTKCIFICKDCNFSTEYLYICAHHLDTVHENECWDGFCKECDKVVSINEKTYSNALYHFVKNHMNVNTPSTGVDTMSILQEQKPSTLSEHKNIIESDNNLPIISHVESLHETAFGSSDDVKNQCESADDSQIDNFKSNETVKEVDMSYSPDKKNILLSVNDDNTMDSDKDESKEIAEGDVINLESGDEIDINLEKNINLLKPGPKCSKNNSIKRGRVTKKRPSKENVIKKYGTADINKLPLMPVLSEDIYCSVCEFHSKVTSNMQRHLQLHISEVSVPNAAPVNPVPHLESDEMHFDKMANLALSSHIEQPQNFTKHAPIPKTYSIPQFIPQKERFVCGSANCSYITLDENALKLHWETLHPDETVFHCVHCKSDVRIFPNAAKYSAPIFSHLRRHGSPLYRCTECNYVHDLVNIIRKHCMKNHGKMCDVLERGLSPIIPEILWYCHLCEAKYKNKKSVLSHCTKVHDILYKFKCSNCPYSADTNQMIYTHAKESHPNINTAVVKVYSNEPNTNISNSMDSSNINKTVPKINEMDKITTPIWWERRKRGSRFIEEELSPEGKPKSKKIKISNYNDFNIAEKLQVTKDAKDLPLNSNDEKSSVPITCIICNFSTSSVIEMKIHLCEELNYRRWRCGNCGYSSFDPEKIKDHSIKEHQISYEPIEGPPNVQFESWIETYLSNPPSCDAATSSKKEMSLIEFFKSSTINKASTSKQSEVSCDAFSSDDEDKLIICEETQNKVENDSLKLYTCLKCKIVLEQQSVDAHAARCHPNAKKLIFENGSQVFKCHICSDLFKDRSVFGAHFTTKHQSFDIKYDRVTLTGELSSLSSNSTPIPKKPSVNHNPKPMLVDSMSKPSEYNFRCNYCSLVFAKYCGLRRHHGFRHKNKMIIIHAMTLAHIENTGELKNVASFNPFKNSTFACFVAGCDDVFTSLDRLKSHVKHHYFIFEKYDCDTCSRNFDSNIAFVDHCNSEHAELQILPNAPMLDRIFQLQNVAFKKRLNKRRWKSKNADKKSTEIVIVP